MKRFLSAKKLAEIYDVTAEFFYNRMDSTFKRGVHYIQHDKNCPIRWDVDEIRDWWYGKKEEPHNDLIEKLLP